MTEGSPNGLYGITRTVDDQMYGDLLLNIDKELTMNSRFSSTVEFLRYSLRCVCKQRPYRLRDGDSGRNK